MAVARKCRRRRSRDSGRTVQPAFAGARWQPFKLDRSPEPDRNHSLRISGQGPAPIHPILRADPVGDLRGGNHFPTGALGELSMNVDVNTLFQVTVYVEALLGLLLLFAWVQNVAVMAAAWWGSAHLLRAGSIALYGMHGSASEL